MRTTGKLTLGGMLILALALVSVPAAHAQSEGESEYKDRTKIDLTGSVIEGQLTKPEGSYVVSRKASRFSSLISLRENFVPKLLISPDQL